MHYIVIYIVSRIRNDLVGYDSLRHVNKIKTKKLIKDDL